MKKLIYGFTDGKEWSHVFLRFLYKEMQSMLLAEKNLTICPLLDDNNTTFSFIPF